MLSASSSPRVFSAAATLRSLGQGHAVVNGARAGAIKPTLGAMGGDSIRFSGKLPQVLSCSYWWAEHQKWLPQQKLRIASVIEAGANRLRTLFAGGMMALATVFPMPDWLLQKISRDYFYSPRKVFNPMSFQAGGLNELNPKILSNSFQIKPGTSNLSTIHSFYLEAAPGKPTIVFSHGRDTNIGHLEGLFKAAKDKEGYGFFAYDYPGFGRSEGHPDEQGLEDAGIAACRFLAGDATASKNLGGYGRSGYQVPYKDQIIMGYSLGGAVAVKVARKFATEPTLFDPEKGLPQGLILVNTFTDIKELFKVKSNALPQRAAQWLSFDRTGLKFDTNKKIKDVKIPIKVFHCDKDKVVPPEQGKRLAEIAKAPLLNLVGHGHGFKYPQCLQVLDTLNDEPFKASNGFHIGPIPKSGLSQSTVSNKKLDVNAVT